MDFKLVVEDLDVQQSLFPAKIHYDPQISFPKLLLCVTNDIRCVISPFDY